MSYKTCNRCEETKHVDMFGKTYNGQYATRKYCKACHKAQKDAWYAKNRERISEKSRKWDAENKEKSRQIKKKWAEANKEKLMAKSKEWKKENKLRVNLSTAMRRKKLRKSTPTWADKEIIKQLYLKAMQEGLTVDHIIPLRGKFVSGLHVHNNLQLLSPSENFKKGNKYAVC